MKIKLTERQLKKLTESISDENLNEGVIDFLKGGYELVKNLFKKFKDGELSATEFKKELEKAKKGKGTERGEIPKGKGYSYNKTSGFKSKERPTHQGIDYRGEKGDFIVLKQGGTVGRVFTGCVVGPKGCGNGYGNFVEVQHNPETLTRYAHLTKPNMKSGDKVNPGDIVGTIGDTGNSFGDHLHFEFEKNGKKIDGSSYAEDYFVILDKSDKYGKSLS
jgi:murein DD-endopeptidase MepM/ murein hydrolase activator NlpD